LRLAAVLVAVLVGAGAFPVWAGAVSGARLHGHAALAKEPTVSGTVRVTFSALVDPNGRATTAYFQFGLNLRYRGPGASRVLYNERTPAVHLRAGFGDHLVSGSVSGLVPHAPYHLRLVASSSAGTVRSRGTTFRTAKEPPPRRPVLGKTANVEPASGLVFVEALGGKSARAAGGPGVADGGGFLPLTETGQLPISSQIDARGGALQVLVATVNGRGTLRATLAGGLFSLAQIGSGLAKGLTTFTLLEGDFPGAPSYASCTTSTAASDRDARTAQLSSRVLQTLHTRDYGGSFSIQGTYSTGTARGATWETIDRCDGTLTIVQRGTVEVFDRGLGTTVAVQAGQTYLAEAPQTQPALLGREP
jgi:hypothetical protein